MAKFAFPDRLPEKQIVDLVEKYRKAVRASAYQQSDVTDALERCAYRDLMEALTDATRATQPREEVTL